MQVVGAVFIGYILAQFLDFEFFTKSTSTPSDSDDSSQKTPLKKSGQILTVM